MKITAVEEYGLRCLVRIVEHDQDDPISAQTIAELEGISVPYTQKIVRTLMKSELVDSKRGAHGGYFPTRPADEISVGDAMRALGGFIEVEELCERHAGDRKVCSNFCNCAIRPVWSHISDFVMATMEKIPLSLLMKDEHAVKRFLGESALDVPAPESDERPTASPQSIN
ncbi:MAG: RrF2 family transcriptional regulator [Myxococcota bacterium]